MTLLERTLNTGLDDKPFADKTSTYAQSQFAMTREVGDLAQWSLEGSAARAATLADLAVKAWPPS